MILADLVISLLLTYFAYPRDYTELFLINLRIYTLFCVLFIDYIKFILINQTVSN
jgi:hypothetical protein